MGKAARRKRLGRTMERMLLRRAGKVGLEGLPVESTQVRPELSLSREPPAASLELVERFDNFAPLRNGLRRIAEERGDWAGIPMPITDERLVIEPSYPFAKDFPTTEPEEIPAGERLKVRNRWYSKRHRGTVIVVEDENGRVGVTYGAGKGIDLEMSTIGCSFAWGVEQEHRALKLLGSLVRPVQFKQYLLTGLLLEKSKRTGIFYIFRKLRPTVALRATKDDRLRILAALCMHPIGYYAGSWAGAMCPTDDVIAHLMLMRGDEPMFWRRANQHGPHSPEAGL